MSLLLLSRPNFGNINKFPAGIAFSVVSVVAELGIANDAAQFKDRVFRSCTRTPGEGESNGNKMKLPK
jgi:hypothetical protein